MKFQEVEFSISENSSNVLNMLKIYTFKQNNNDKGNVAMNSRMEINVKNKPQIPLPSKNGKTRF